MFVASVPVLAISTRLGYFDPVLETFEKVKAMLTSSSAVEQLSSEQTSLARDEQTAAEPWRLRTPEVYAAMTQPLGALNSNATTTNAQPSSPTSSSQNVVSQEQFVELRKELNGVKAKLAVTDSEARKVKSELEDAKAEKEKLADEAKRREDEANEVKAQLERARSEQKKLTNEIKRKEEEMNDSVRSNEQAAAKSAAVAEAEMKRTVEESLAEKCKVAKRFRARARVFATNTSIARIRVEFYENRYNANGKGITR